MNALQYLRHYTLQKFGNDLLMTFVLFLNVHAWKTFSITLITFIKILSLLWRRKVMGNWRFLTLYWNGIMERSLYIGSLRILTNTLTIALTTRQVARKGCSSLFNITYSISTNKGDLPYRTEVAKFLGGD